MTLSGKQISIQARHLLVGGMSRKDVYNSLLPQVDSEKKLAYAVARYVDHETYTKHKGKLDTLLVIIGLQLIISTLGLIVLTEFVMTGVVIAGVIAVVLGYIMYLISKLDPVGFTLYFLLIMQNIIRLRAENFEPDEVNTSIATIVITLGCMIYTGYVQGKLMPHLPFFFTPLKGKTAKYTFLEQDFSEALANTHKPD